MSWFLVVLVRNFSAGRAKVGAWGDQQSAKSTQLCQLVVSLLFHALYADEGKFLALAGSAANALATTDSGVCGRSGGKESNYISRTVGCRDRGGRAIGDSIHITSGIRHDTSSQKLPPRFGLHGFSVNHGVGHGCPCGRSTSIACACFAAGPAAERHRGDRLCRSEHLARSYRRNRTSA